MAAEQIINPSTVVTNGAPATTANPVPAYLVGGIAATSIAVGSTLVNGGVTQQLLYDNAGVLGEITKANSSVLVTNGSGVPAWGTALPSGLTATGMVLTTPTLGVAIGTSLALGGATIGSNALAVTGTAQFNGSTTWANSLALTVGAGGSITINNAVGLNGNATGDIVSVSTGRIGFASSTNPAAAPDTFFTRSGAGGMVANGTLSTAAPAGASAGLWKLGSLVTAAVTPDATRSIFVDIGGVVYKLIVAT